VQDLASANFIGGQFSLEAIAQHVQNIVELSFFQ